MIDRLVPGKAPVIAASPASDGATLRRAGAVRGAPR
jgi:hypothetical protein